MLLIVLLAVGGSVLACFCACGVGFALLWSWGTPKLVEAVLVGTWKTADGKTTFEFREGGKMKKDGVDLVYKVLGGNLIEIGPHKEGKKMPNGQPHATIRFRVDSRAARIILTELSRDPPGGQPEDFILERR